MAVSPTAARARRVIPDDQVVGRGAVHLAVGETVILLHLPVPLVGVSIVMERERQQNDSLVRGYVHQPAVPLAERRDRVVGLQHRVSREHLAVDEHCHLIPPPPPPPPPLAYLHQVFQEG